MIDLFPQGRSQEPGTDRMTIPDDFKPLEKRAGWYQAPEGDVANLLDRVLRLQDEIALPTQVIVGLMGESGRHRIYIIEDVEPVEIIEQFAVGSHALGSYGRDDSELCYDEMEKLYRLAPYRPYFADAAGFKARFLEPLTHETSLAIESLLTVGLGIFESEWDGGEHLFVDRLMAENQLQLWWD